MKRILVLFVILCIFYFIGGYFAVSYGLLEQNTYIVFASIAGGIASVVGLLSLTRPTITRSDIQNIELESLKRIADAAKELEKYKHERNAAQEELSKLSLQKEEMQFLVKKASLSLFLQDRLESAGRRINEVIGEHKELEPLIEEYGELAHRLEALEVEIRMDKNVDILREVLKSAKRSRPIESVTVESLGLEISLPATFRYLRRLFIP